MLLAVSLSCALIVPAHAQTVEELQARLDAQDARIKQLEAGIARLSSAGAAPTTIAAAPAAPLVAAATPVPAMTGEPTVKLRGRAQFDMLALNRGDGATPTGTQIRRFYLGAEGRIAPTLRYQAEADFAGN